MSIDDIRKALRRTFQGMLKNLVSLANDSTLEGDLKVLKVGEDNTKIQLSQTETKLSGKLTVDGDAETNIKTTDKISLTSTSEMNLKATESHISIEGESTVDIQSNTRDVNINSARDLELSSTRDILLEHDDTVFGLIDGGTSSAKSRMFLYEAGGSSTDDYFLINVTANGATALQTIDAAGAVAHLTLQPDGDLILDPASQKVILNATDGLYFDGGIDTYIKQASPDVLIIYAGGEALFVAEESATTSVAQSSKTVSMCPHLLKDIGGVADTPPSGFGAMYVNSDVLYFKTDGGTVTNLLAGGSVSEFYETKVCNYYTNSVNNQFIPLAGYVIERDSISGQNEYVSMVAPYNGTIERIMFRSEAAQNGTLEFDIFESSDGTELPGTITGVKDTAIDIADDTTVEVNFDSMTSGTNALVKGRIYAIQIDTPSIPYDTNVTVVFKWDVTT